MENKDHHRENNANHRENNGHHRENMVYCMRQSRKTKPMNNNPHYDKNKKGDYSLQNSLL